MPSLHDAVDEAVAWLTARLRLEPEVAIVLGSGLGALVEHVADAQVIASAGIPRWPATGVAGHAGTLVTGRLQGRSVLVLSGRPHVYEGHDLATLTLPIRVVARLGVRALIVTNAAGGINPDLEPGRFMVIADHLNLMGTNPLVGPHDPRFGERFPDMSQVYSARLRAVATAAAREAGVPLAHGVYAAVIGPSYETPAEIRALGALGADAVGMSTVPEAIVARQMGLDVLGISCITNMAAGILPQPLGHEEVLETARRVEAPFAALLESIVSRL